MNLSVPAAISCGLLALTLVGCGQSPAAAPTDDQSASQTADATATTAKDFDGDQYADTGEGAAYVTLGDQSTESGSVLDIPLAQQQRPVEVEVELRGLTGDSPVFVYVDGVLSLREDDVEESHELTLKGADLSEGIHSIEIVRFHDADPSGTVDFYRMARYSVRS